KSLQECMTKIGKSIVDDALADGVDEAEDELKIVQRRKAVAEDLFGGEEVAEVGAAEGAAGVAGAALFNRARVFAERRLANVQAAVRRVDGAVAGEAGWRDAVERVDPPLDAGEEILRLADAEEMARLAVGKQWDRPVENGVHVLLRSPERAA